MMHFFKVHYLKILFSLPFFLLEGTLIFLCIQVSNLNNNNLLAISYLKNLESLERNNQLIAAEVPAAIVIPYDFSYYYFVGGTIAIVLTISIFLFFNYDNLDCFKFLSNSSNISNNTPKGEILEHIDVMSDLLDDKISLVNYSLMTQNEKSSQLLLEKFLELENSVVELSNKLNMIIVNNDTVGISTVIVDEVFSH